LTAFLFFIGSLAAVASAALVVTRKNPVHSALFLILCLLSVALLFLLLGAQFVAAIQVIVYAGAIVVLFLFVVMLLNIRRETAVFHSSPVHRLAAVALVLALLVQTLAIAGGSVVWVKKLGWVTQPNLSFGTVQAVGRELFERYLFQFEVASVLLLAAVVGAAAIVKKKL